MEFGKEQPGGPQWWGGAVRMVCRKRRSKMCGRVEPRVLPYFAEKLISAMIGEWYWHRANGAFCESVQFPDIQTAVRGYAKAVGTKSAVGFAIWGSMILKSCKSLQAMMLVMQTSVGTILTRAHLSPTKTVTLGLRQCTSKLVQSRVSRR